MGNLKELEQFKVQLDLKVIGVRGETKPIYKTPENPTIGASYRNIISGTVSTLYIDVIPISGNSPKEQPVKMLKFSGSWPIFTGDIIRAYVIAAQRNPDRRNPIYEWEKRKLREVERAIKIEKLGKNGEDLATYENSLDLISD